MKQPFAILSAAVVAVLILAAGTAAAGDFRRAEWGMSKEEVREAELEAEPFGETELALTYQGEVAGVGALILYIFRDGKLVRGVYSFRIAGPETAIGDYRAVRSFLLDRHGPAAEEEIASAGSTEPADDDELLRLVLSGAASPTTTWHTEGTDIYLRLTEMDGNAAVEAHYLGRD